jgi:hypothetical protein
MDGSSINHKIIKCRTWAVGLVKYNPYYVTSLLGPYGYTLDGMKCCGHGPHSSMMSCEVNIELMRMNYRFYLFGGNQLRSMEYL